MRLLTLSVLVIACVEAVPKQRRSTPEEESIERLKRETINKMQHNMGRSIEEINEKSGVAGAYHGDILFTRDELEEVGTRSKRQAMSNLKKRWPNKTVPYIFYYIDEKTKDAFKKAAQLWMNNTCIDFNEHPQWTKRGDPIPPTGHLVVSPGKGCFSYVGKNGEGPQSLILGEGCGSVGITAHEIGHALGFYHTQARYDRDEYVTVNNANIEPDWTPDFGKQDKKDNNNYGLTYDYGSIMHYGSYSSLAAINKNERIITANDGKYTATLGSDIISFYDLLMMNKLYDCLDNCSDNKPDCQNEGFAHPRDCSRCICPSGFGGPLCDKKPSTCGDELEATDNWQSLQRTLEDGEKGEEQDEYKRCTYWIKAPANVDNAKIEVRITELPQEFNEDGCIYAGVEIKAHEDKRLTGYRFCSQNDIGTELSSNSKIVPVIVYSGSRKKAFSAKLDYRYTLTEN